ncbi:hypothetical protein EDF59_1618 [Novosphingobium sp. ST904]|nr:hypothetical protein EDF59_1618 [Novosphingobium sp. ST904]
MPGGPKMSLNPPANFVPDGGDTWGGGFAARQLSNLLMAGSDMS